MGHIIISHIIIIGILLFIYVIPVVITIFNIINLIKKKAVLEFFIDILTFVLGIPLSVLLFWFWNAKEYTEPIILGRDDFTLHTPISYKHMLTFLVIAVVAIIGYWILRIKKENLPPIITVLCISSMYLGMALGIIFIIQIAQNIFSESTLMPYDALYLTLFPLNYILCSIRLMRQVITLKINDQAREEDKLCEYEFSTDPQSLGTSSNEKVKGIYNNRFLNFCYRLLLKSAGWYTAAFLLMIPLLGILLIILVIFGQSPDSIIKAFTETSDWTLSQEISPPPIEDYSGHYLCTVALKGHKKLVKPTRMGIRHGEKIVVNRQLCIANAFEQVIQERLPKLHKLIRNVYDNYGYPLSKHITTKWRADIVYILMKPLEWLFLLILYSFDIKPENRIAMQYTGRTAIKVYPNNFSSK
ncbi:MAG: hypothetical protein GX383_03750 [Clostridium sp.]|nr:hypothetical protein [Clostridium sp.]